MGGRHVAMRCHTFTVFCAERAGRKRLEFTAEKRYRTFVDGLGLGEVLRVRIDTIPKPQGTQSMRYYRGVVVPDIARACGYDDPDDFQEVHESLAWKFLRLSDHPTLGYPRRRSTSKNEMGQDEISAYIDQCITWAESSIPGCRVRRPNEVDLDDIYAPDYDAKAA